MMGLLEYLITLFFIIKSLFATKNKKIIIKQVNNDTPLGLVEKGIIL